MTDAKIPNGTFKVVYDDNVLVVLKDGYGKLTTMEKHKLLRELTGVYHEPGEPFKKANTKEQDPMDMVYPITTLPGEDEYTKVKSKASRLFRLSIAALLVIALVQIIFSFAVIQDPNLRVASSFSFLMGELLTMGVVFLLRAMDSDP